MSIPDNLYYYRRHSKSLSATKTAQVYDATYRVLEKHFLFFYASMPGSRARRRFLANMERWGVNLDRGQIRAQLCTVSLSYRCHLLYWAVRRKLGVAYRKIKGNFKGRVAEIARSFRRTKKVLVLWHSVDTNFGDYLIYKTVCACLISWGYEPIGLDVGLPFDKIAAKARECDWMWFAGGGIIERYIPDVIRNFPAFHQQSGRIKYGVTGLSIGEFDYSDHSAALSYWVKEASYFLTRDQYSADELNRLSKSDWAKASVDVVFAYGSLPIVQEERHNAVGVNLRDVPYVDISGDFQWKEWESSIKSTFKEKVIGISDQYDYSKNIELEVHEKYSPENVMDTLLKTDYVLAMRYHVCLISARMGKVPIPICYCPKVHRLAEQLGIENLALGIHDYGRLSEVVEKYRANELYYQNLLRENVLIMENQAKEMLDFVHAKMEECLK